MPGQSRSSLVLVTFICFVMATLVWGTVFYGHSVYMDALTRLHGWSTAMISSAILVFWISSLPGTLSVGILVDRFGPAPVVALGGVLIGGGLIAMSEVSEPWHLFLIYIAMGFGYPALASAAISSTLASRFNSGFSTALGFALTGASVGGAVLPVYMVQSAAANGFEQTMIEVGAVLLVTILIAALVLKFLGQPQQVTATDGNGNDFSMAEVLRRPLFWKISIAAAIALGGQVGLLAHQVPIIAAKVDQTTAAYMVTVVAVASAVGRIMVAQLSRFMSIGKVTALSYALHGIGIAGLALTDDMTGIFIACAVAGLVVGAIVMLPPILVRHAFGTVGYGRTFAMVNVVMYVLAALAPWAVGMIQDQTGAYTLGLWMLVAMEVVAAVLILNAMRERPA